jgi:hypothetical protein
VNPVEWLEEEFNKTWERWGHVHNLGEYNHFHVDPYAFRGKKYRVPGNFILLKED